MAKVRCFDDRRFTLGAHVAVGRSPDAPIPFRDSRVSSMHAALSWMPAEAGGASEETWCIRDLGSRNGTWVEGVRLAPGEQVPLPNGGTAWFASPDLWLRIIDGGPPICAARAGTRRCEGSAQLLALPTAEEPRAAVYPKPGGGWVIERDGQVDVATDGAVVEIDGLRWTLELPVGTDTSRTVGQPGAPTIEFRVSPDEEYAEFDVSAGDAVHRFKGRSYHYLLLTLARLREGDPEGGWVERADLARMLRVETKTVDVNIHRARVTLDRQAPGLGAALVETGSRQGQVRLGLPVRGIRRLS